MPITNKDFISEKTRQLAQKIVAATKDGNEDAVVQAFSDFQADVSAKTSEEIEHALQQMNGAVLASRGVKQLTSEETEFFQKIVDASSSVNPKQAISDLNKALPETVIDTVIEDIKGNHPLLDAIDFTNTSAITKMIYNADDVDLATWDELNTAIATELAGAIDVLDMTLCKLSAYMPVPRDMIDLGPSWLLTLVVGILSEAAGRGLEAAIVDGDGSKKPIGMTRDLDAGSVSGGITTYARKTPVVLSAINPTTYNAIVAALTAKPNGGYRAVTEVAFICNPVDYLTKVLPATTVMGTDGTYKGGVFPFPTVVIPSAEISQGKAVIGLAKKYFMGIGGNKAGKIEYDDSYQFLADNRVYKIKLYGNGRPKDNNAFVYVDISGLTPRNLEVKVIDTVSAQILNTSSAPVLTAEVDYPDVSLKALSVGSLTLSPTFAADKLIYTAATTNATNTITATATDSEATVVIKNGTTTVTSGSAATWAEGANIVTVTVTNGDEERVYIITVTKSTE